jgi:hypothetical protein
MKRLAALTLVLGIVSPGLASAQMRTSGIVGIAGGAAVGGLGPAAAMVAPVLGPLVGGLVPLIGALETQPCFICTGVRVQPKDNDQFLSQFHSGMRIIPGINADIVIGAPYQENGALTPENTEQLLYIQFGLFDISLNPETDEVSFGYLSGEQGRLPVFDALPIAAPIMKSDERLKIGELGPRGLSSTLGSGGSQ